MTLPLSPAQRDLAAAHLDVADRAARLFLARAPRSIDGDAIRSHAHVGLCAAAATYRADRGASFRTWASAKCRGAILDGVRAETRTRMGVCRAVRARPLSDLDAEEIPDVLPDMDAAIDARDLVALLPQRDRAVVWLHLVEGWTLLEIGERVLRRSEGRALQIEQGALASLRAAVS